MYNQKILNSLSGIKINHSIISEIKGLSNILLILGSMGRNLFLPQNRVIGFLYWVQHRLVKQVSKVTIPTQPNTNCMSTYSIGREVIRKTPKLIDDEDLETRLLAACTACISILRNTLIACYVSQSMMVQESFSENVKSE